jgi:hypothetical protein
LKIRQHGPGVPLVGMVGNPAWRANRHDTYRRLDKLT